MAKFGKNGLLPLFLKYLVQCLFFDIIKHGVSVLKLNLKKKKIFELQVELDSSNVEFYIYFDT